MLQILLPKKSLYYYDYKLSNPVLIVDGKSIEKEILRSSVHGASNLAGGDLSKFAEVVRLFITNLKRMINNLCLSWLYYE